MVRTTRMWAPELEGSGGRKWENNKSKGKRTAEQQPWSGKAEQPRWLE